MSQANQLYEPLCPLCLEPLDLRSLYLAKKLCPNCTAQLEWANFDYQIDGIYYATQFVYNDFLERCLFQFKDQKDIALAEVLAWQKPLRGRIAGMPSNQLERGFSPLGLLFKDVEFPLYKTHPIRQAKRQAEQRGQLDHIQKKQYYEDANYNWLVDDVCTTGATIERGLSLLKVHQVAILAVHPLWQKKHEASVVKKRRFW